MVGPGKKTWPLWHAYFGVFLQCLPVPLTCVMFPLKKTVVMEYLDSTSLTLSFSFLKIGLKFHYQTLSFLWMKPTLFLTRRRPPQSCTSKLPPSAVLFSKFLQENPAKLPKEFCKFLSAIWILSLPSFPLYPCPLCRLQDNGPSTLSSNNIKLFVSCQKISPL